MNQIKKIFPKLAFSIVLFMSIAIRSEAQTADSLIEKINNKDAYIVMLRKMSPRIHSEAGDRIISLGKKATPALIKVLDTENKGIIAHFLLSEIWKETWEEEMCCNISGNGATEIITINGLKIYIEGNTLFSKSEDLKKNKEAWKKRSEA